MRKLLLFISTARFLKQKQVFFLIYYKLKRPFIRWIKYNSYNNSTVHNIAINAGFAILSEGKYLKDNRFSFLNRVKQFDGIVDWNFAGYGKLWNYNLQYFDYLHDAAISGEEKRRLIEECSIAILTKKIKPEPYPVSLRLINWLIYKSASGYNSQSFVKAIQYQVDYLRNNLEYHIQANHLLENYFSLLVAGFALRDTKVTFFALKGVNKELNEQILADGGHYECSPMYHCIILSKLLLVNDLIRSNKWISLNNQIIRAKASAMLSWIASFSYKDGSYAHFNDSINGIVPSSRVLIDYGKILGINCLKSELRESGFRKFSFGDYETVVDVGNIIPSYQSGHTHSDMLSFCLNYRGKPVFVDPGTSTYERNERRSWERSSLAHNTVVINNDSQSEVWGSFRVGKRAKLHIEKDEPFYLSANHTGYMQPHGVVHRRIFQFKEKEVIIKDELIGKIISGQLHLYLDNSLTPPVIELNQAIISAEINISFEEPSKVSVLSYQQPLEFNKTVVSPVLRIDFTDSITYKISFL